MEIVGLKFFDEIYHTGHGRVELKHKNLYINLPMSTETIDFIRKVFTLDPGAGNIFVQKKDIYITNLIEGQLTRYIHHPYHGAINPEAPSNMDPIVAKYYYSDGDVEKIFTPQLKKEGLYYKYYEGFIADGFPGPSWKDLGLHGLEDVFKTLPVYALDVEGRFWALPVDEAKELLNKLVETGKPVSYKGPAELWIGKGTIHNWEVYERYKDLKKPEEHFEEYVGRINFGKLRGEFYGPLLHGDEYGLSINSEDAYIHIDTDVTGARKFITETLLGATEYSKWLRKLLNIKPLVTDVEGVRLYKACLGWKRIIKNFKISYHGTKPHVIKIHDGPNAVVLKTGKYHKVRISENGIERLTNIF